MSYDGKDIYGLNDKELSAFRRRRIGFIFQQYNLLPKSNLLENVELPLLYAKVPGEERRERAMKALERVGLEDKWKHFPRQLSGGQQQRVSIARALAKKAPILFLDDSTSALDMETEQEIQKEAEKSRYM